jgi:hypothetical protein
MVVRRVCVLGHVYMKISRLRAEAGECGDQRDREDLS